MIQTITLIYGLSLRFSDPHIKCILENSMQYLGRNANRTKYKGECTKKRNTSEFLFGAIGGRQTSGRGLFKLCYLNNTYTLV